MNRIGLACASIAIVTLVCVAFVAAGPLDPPGGPVAPTHKTLTEVEPRIAINATNTPGDADSIYRINQSGSYYLTGNIGGFSGFHGIEIAVSNVTIDLNGFVVDGSVGGALSGIRTASSGPVISSITVRDGTVRGWGGSGVSFAAATTNTRIESVHVFANAVDGIDAPNNSVIQNCTASANGGDGIKTRVGCTISDCAANENAGIGISTGVSCTLANCTASKNSGAGIDTNDACTIVNCSATLNSAGGILAGLFCTLQDCAASRNGSNGIRAGTGSAFSNCTSNANQTGFVASNDSTLSNCSAAQNASAGYFAGPNAALSNCSASTNGEDGFVLELGSELVDSSASSNTLNGVKVTSGCTIRGCTLFGNGRNTGDGAGIRATGSDNRIEGNNCIGADRGIDIDFPGNFIIRNICTDNTVNWTIVAGNFPGPIIVSSGNGADINGNGYLGGLGTTDPNANFTY